MPSWSASTPTMTVNSNIAVNISDQDPMELLTVHKPIAPLSIHNRAGFPHTCRPRIDCLPSSCQFVRNEFTPSPFSLWSSLGGRSPTCRGLRLPHHHCSTNAVGGSFCENNRLILPLHGLLREDEYFLVVPYPARDGDAFPYYLVDRSGLTWPGSWRAC